MNISPFLSTDHHMLGVSLWKAYSQIYAQLQSRKTQHKVTVKIARTRHSRISSYYACNGNTSITGYKQLTVWPHSSKTTASVKSSVVNQQQCAIHSQYFDKWIDVIVLLIVKVF
jgi:hypothetical protein